MNSLKLVSACIAVTLLAACGSSKNVPWASTHSPYATVKGETEQFTLARTACFGFCPIYRVTVDQSDALYFEGERFVAEEGATLSKRLPGGSFNKLVKIAKSYGFSSYDPRYPNEAANNCGAVATDMPSVIISFESKSLTHEVNLYQGCFDFEGRERFEEMVAAMDAVLDVDKWVGPREKFTEEQQ